MKTRIICVSLLLGGVLAMSVGGQAQGQKPAPRVRADCPQGNCCLMRVGRLSSGKLEYKLDPPYECPLGRTARGSGFLELKPLKSAGPPCDESQMLIPEGSQLNAAIHPIHRQDDLAHICGTFTIMFENKALFEGDIDLLHRVNTHSKPFGTDPCDAKNHLQGWLIGKGVDGTQVQGQLLRAMLVARTDPINGGNGGYALGETHINGVIINCKP